MKVVYALQSADGMTFEEIESAELENVLLGSEAAAEIKEFEGFTYDPQLENAKQTAETLPGLILYLGYTRNAYTVSYRYDGEIPENAPELPMEETHLFGTDVTIASSAKMDGYRFSGWDHEAFTMPAEDVVILGSFEKEPEPEKEVIPAISGKDDPKPEASEAKADTENKADNGFVLPAPAVPAAAQTVTDLTEAAKAEPQEAPETEILTDEAVPMAVMTAEAAEKEAEEMTAPAAEAVIIEEESTPLAAPKYWALVNLLCAAAAVLTAILMFLSFLKKNKAKDEENDDEAQEQKARRNNRKLTGIIPAAFSVIFFILTENVKNPMQLTDKWTVVMVIAALAGILLMILTADRKEEKEDEMPEAQAVLQ